METPADRNTEGPSPAAGSVNEVASTNAMSEAQKDGDGEVIYYMDEQPQANPIGNHQH